MSIYCSRVTAGYDYFDSKHHGRVVAYPENNLARVSSEDWPEGSIDTAHVPHWCVPGHQTHYGEDWPVSEWLRFSVDVAGTHVSVLLDEEAVRTLRKDFTRWLKLNKAYADKPCDDA